MLINTRDVYYFGTKTRAPREDSDSRSHSNKHRHSIGMPILTSDKMYSINYGLDRVRFTNPLRIAHLVDECLSLVQPLADGRRITLRKPERESRLYEGRADHELVTCSAKEQECLLEEGLPPCYTRRVS